MTVFPFIRLYAVNFDPVMTEQGPREVYAVQPDPRPYPNLALILGPFGRSMPASGNALGCVYKSIHSLS